MARVWQRLWGSVLFGVLVVGLWNCKAAKQKPGDKCTHENKYLCEDATSGLLCQNGTIVALACRGPRGCQTLGSGNYDCDDDVGMAGEACIMPPPGSVNISCTADKKAELQCQTGKWTQISLCKGPKGCRNTGGKFSCDDDFSDVGDTCTTQANEANYSCTPDKKSEVVCQNNTFVMWRPCQGPRGCNVENDQIICDASFGTAGDACRQVDTSACTLDATQMLKCSPQFKWVKDKDCKKEGCKVKGNNVYCR